MPVLVAGRWCSPRRAGPALAAAAGTAPPALPRPSPEPCGEPPSPLTRPLPQGVLFGMIASVVPSQPLPGLGRISGTVWAVTDLALGACVCWLGWLMGHVPWLPALVCLCWLHLRAVQTRAEGAGACLQQQQQQQQQQLQQGRPTNPKPRTPPDPPTPPPPLAPPHPRCAGLALAGSNTLAGRLTDLTLARGMGATGCFMGAIGATLAAALALLAFMAWGDLGREPEPAAPPPEAAGAK